MNPLILIPARMASTRLPGKPLTEIAGEAMIVQCWARAMESGVGRVVVACDGEPIAQAIRNAGGEAVLTDPNHPSGSDRIYEALCQIDPEKQHDIIVNLQGDLPTLDPALVREVLAPLQDTSIDIATLAAVITDEEEKTDPNVVKVVMTSSPLVKSVGSPLAGEQLRARDSDARSVGGLTGSDQRAKRMALSNRSEGTILSNAKALRKNMTGVEQKLWTHLSGKRFHSCKFRRQQPVDCYIVDFASFQHRLIIELDGGQHAENERDSQRTAYLEKNDFRVLRFWNHDVLENIDGVLATIEQTLNSPHALPSADRLGSAAPPQGGSNYHKALYFTRATAPCGDGPLYHHIGIYAYRRETLERFVMLPQGELEKREKLEQLRALENGIRIGVVIVDTVPLGVDTQEQLERARVMLGG